ncbi:MAG: hypothetical protein KAS71_06705, partial [Bacteroidales bacterium]|nr:hypothetical protein [Bacteroidales bacterium]
MKRLTFILIVLTFMGLVWEVGAQTVTLSAGDATIAEDGGTSLLTATLSETSVSIVTVNLDYTSSTATAVTDYTGGVASIDIAIGELTGTTTITGVDDALYEGDE